jgi:hypothetical protein
MSKTIAFSTIAAVALAGATFLSAAEPVAAREYEYCREDYTVVTVAARACERARLTIIKLYGLVY